ncbi:MAG: hypothetical protein SFV15_10875 [Polyangiaceae bacterium]|nr:hypothetical protein [Polyangiaceae bacterium]
MRSSRSEWVRVSIVLALGCSSPTPDNGAMSAGQQPRGGGSGVNNATTGGKGAIQSGGSSAAITGGRSGSGGISSVGVGGAANSAIGGSGGTAIVDVSGGAPSTSGGTSASGGTSNSGAGGSSPGVGAALDGQRWESNCGAVAEGDDSLCFNYPPNTSSCPEGGYVMLDKQVAFGGTPGITYDVTLRFRGVVEPKIYTGGTSDGMHFSIGGLASDSNYNVYSLEVSSPHQVYFVNSDTDEGHYVFAIDTTRTIKIEGGATLKLYGLDNNCISIANVDGVVAPAGVAPAPTPKGQFVEVNVVSLTPAN